MHSEYNDELIKKHSKIQKKLFIITLILTTLICSGPPAWLIYRIVNNETEKLLSTAIITIPILMWMTFMWCSYFYGKKVDKYASELDDLEMQLNEYKRKFDELENKKDSL